MEYTYGIIHVIIYYLELERTFETNLSKVVGFELQIFFSIFWFLLIWLVQLFFLLKNSFFFLRWAFIIVYLFLNNYFK